MHASRLAAGFQRPSLPPPLQLRSRPLAARGGSSCGNGGNGAAAAAAAGGKLVWLSTSSQDVLTTALEAGVSPTVVWETPEQKGLVDKWQQLGRFDAVERAPDGRLLDSSGATVRPQGLGCVPKWGAGWGLPPLVYPALLAYTIRPVPPTPGGSKHSWILLPPSPHTQVGCFQELAGPDDLRRAEREAAAAEGVVVMDASDWQVRLWGRAGSWAGQQHTHERSCIAFSPQASLGSDPPFDPSSPLPL